MPVPHGRAARRPPQTRNGAAPATPSYSLVPPGGFEPSTPALGVLFSRRTATIVLKLYGLYLRFYECDSIGGTIGSKSMFHICSTRPLWNMNGRDDGGIQQRKRLQA